ncbi:cell division protein FtsW [Idiomarina xiamenensis]|nr:cell division protein FtsW [Idiomarina xiamenensis]
MNANNEQQLAFEISAPTVWQRVRGWLMPQQEMLLYDRQLLLLALALMAFGFVMVCSASLPVAERLTGNPFYFAIRHGMYIVAALTAACCAMFVPMSLWQQQSGRLLLLGLLMLAAVLVVGHTVNGAKRWFKIGPMTVQAAELAKLFFYVYIASYLVRRLDEVRENLKGFIKPLVLLFVAAVLLLLEPDLGTVVVLSATTIAMLFLAGAKLWQFFAVALTCTLAIVLLIILEPYRMERLMSFRNPFQDPYGAGFQLTQSLIAFGQGNVDGLGLGNSIQKLAYLPEAHTDFIMAVVAEELGFIGVMLVIMLVLAMVLRIMRLGRQALLEGQPYGGFLAYGIGVWFSIQAFVNIGVAAGALPTKGLTLPLVSYGGTSLIVSSVAVAILLRIDYELRLARVKVTPGRRQKS